MIKYEFLAVVDANSERILIPERYRGLIKSNMKVVVMDESDLPAERTASFTAMRVDTKGFKFDREEANKR